MALIPLISKFNFYQQIRLLLRGLRDGKKTDETLLDEALHLTSTLSLNAPEGDVESLSQAAPGEPLTVTAFHHGLTGAMGALPSVYTEWLIERQYRYSDGSAKAFFDLFGHRLYCLDYLAWQKNHLYALAESTDSSPLNMAILALTGLTNEAPVPAMVNHAALFAAPVRSMVNLERWLSQLFAVPAQVIPFTGGWRSVSDEERCQLGNPQHRLETAPMLGAARREAHAHFDVLLGPMSAESSRRFIPQGAAWQDLWARIRDYVGPVMDFSVSLLISRSSPGSSPLGMHALGVDFCLGSSAGTYLHKVQKPAPAF